jgi:hypothetical protein
MSQAWIGTRYILSANEGDLDGGSRGFTIFDSGKCRRYEVCSRCFHALNFSFVRFGQQMVM